MKILSLEPHNFNRNSKAMGDVRPATLLHPEPSYYQENITIDIMSEYFYSGLPVSDGLIMMLWVREQESEA
jgi:hypothetical protein